MQTFQMYLANARGQKLSGYVYIDAKNISEARKEFRKQHENRFIDWLNVEILAEIK